MHQIYLPEMWFPQNTESRINTGSRVGSRRHRCDAICNRRPGGSGAEPQSQTVFAKYLIEWSSFSSTVYHVSKTVQDFEQVDDVHFIFMLIIHLL